MLRKYLRSPVNEMVDQIVRDKIKELEEENKKLKEKYDGLWGIYTSEANELKEENRKLKEELGKFIMKS